MKIIRLTVSVMILSKSMRGAMWKSNTKYCETERMSFILANLSELKREMKFTSSLLMKEILRSWNK